MFGLFGPKNYENLQGREFKEKYLSARNAVLIDVRTAGEYRAGTIKGARNLDVMSPSFISQMETLDKSKEYFLFCRSGNRSARACQLLARQGFKVYNLAGPPSDWPV